MSKGNLGGSSLQGFYSLEVPERGFNGWSVSNHWVLQASAAPVGWVLREGERPPKASLAGLLETSILISLGTSLPIYDGSPSPGSQRVYRASPAGFTFQATSASRGACAGEAMSL